MPRNSRLTESWQNSRPSMGNKPMQKAVEYWIYQVKLRGSDMEDETNHGRLPLDDVDTRILACLSHKSFSSIHSIAQDLGLVPATVR
jgi:hypothetical protein